MSDRRKIRWLIAHFPVHLFQRTAEAFTQELEALLPGQFEVEIHTIDSYCDQYQKLEALRLKKPSIPGLEEPVVDSQYQVEQISDMQQKWTTFFDALRAGDFEMSQTQVFTVAEQLKNKDFAALDLPFLFDSHDHVSRVLDGEIGNEMCNKLAETSDVRGLAFTYSGGYRIIGNTTGIKSLDELAMNELIVSSEPSKVLFNELGTTTLNKASIDVASLADSGAKGTAVETTYIRFTGKHVLKTNHSMFLTTILTGTKFWNSLTTEQQEAFATAAKRVAKIERQWSVDDAAEYEQNAQANGVTIVDLSDADRERLSKRAKLSYRHVEQMGIDMDLVKRIIERRKD
jgi:TRAP-type C4-dicarboxylate transport system substrate-binding protein